MRAIAWFGILVLLPACGTQAGSGAWSVRLLAGSQSRTPEGRVFVMPGEYRVSGDSRDAKIDLGLVVAEDREGSLTHMRQKAWSEALQSALPEESARPPRAVQLHFPRPSLTIELCARNGKDAAATSLPALAVDIQGCPTTFVEGGLGWCPGQAFMCNMDGERLSDVRKAGKISLALSNPDGVLGTYVLRTVYQAHGMVDESFDNLHLVRSSWALSAGLGLVASGVVMVVLAVAAGNGGN